MGPKPSIQRGCAEILGDPTPRSPHHHVLETQLVCLSPQVFLTTEYLASHESSTGYPLPTTILEEHQQSSTHNSREHFLAVTFLLSSLDSDGNKCGRRATATATTWAMAMATRLAGDKEGKCKGSKSNGDGNEGGWQWGQRLKQGQRWQRWRQWLWRCQTTTETAGAGNNQQNVAGGSGSSGDSGHGSGNCCSAAATAGRGGGAAQVTTMRAVATATNTPFYPWPW